MFKKTIATLGTLSIITGATLVGAATSDDTTFQLEILEGVLAVAIVDATGVEVTTPEVDFGSITASFADQTIAGTLGTATEKIRASNPTGTATWNVSIAATSGSTALWSDGVDTLDFNDLAGTEALEVQASGGAIAAVHNASTANVSVGSDAHFDQGTVDSITLMSAAAGAATFEEFDLTGVAVEQDIPAAQPAGLYSIDMTVSIL